MCTITMHCGATCLGWFANLYREVSSNFCKPCICIAVDVFCNFMRASTIGPCLCRLHVEIRTFCVTLRVTLRYALTPPPRDGSPFRRRWSCTGFITGLGTPELRKREGRRGTSCWLESQELGEPSRRGAGLLGTQAHGTVLRRREHSRQDDLGRPLQIEAYGT